MEEAAYSIRKPIAEMTLGSTENSEHLSRWHWNNAAGNTPYAPIDWLKKLDFAFWLP